MTKKIKRVANFSELRVGAKRGSALPLANEAAEASGLEERLPHTNYLYKEGWHFYSWLKFTQRLENAEDHEGMRKHLLIMEEFMAIAKSACELFGFANILEFQGDVVHFFLEPGEYGLAVEEIKWFATYISGMVQKKIVERYPTLFRHLHHATDYGNSVILSLHAFEPASDSLVSLGPSANAPAKQMVESAESIRRPLWLPAEHVQEADKRCTWVAVETLEKIEGVLNKVGKTEDDGVAAYKRAKASVRARAVPGAIRKVMCTAAPLREPHEEQATVDDPEILQAFICRADIDGFSGAVEAAFKEGIVAVEKLVDRFIEIAKYTTIYKERAGWDIVDLAWTGDCANFVVKLRRDESYERAARYMPTSIAEGWHSQLDEGLNGDGKGWRKLMGECEWVFCPAGGKLFLADISDGSLNYRIVSGWGSGVSRSGVNASSTRADWTVMHNDNVAELKSELRGHFEKLNSNFKYIPFAKLKECSERAIKGVAADAIANKKVNIIGAGMATVPGSMAYCDTKHERGF